MSRRRKDRIRGKKKWDGMNGRELGEWERIVSSGHGED